MDALGKLDEVAALVNSGRRLGGRTIIEAGSVLARLAEARQLLVGELATSRAVVAERDAILAEGRSEVEALRAEVAAERLAPLVEAEVSAESKRILEEASVFAERSLAELEAVLQRVLSAITRARTAFDGSGSVLGASGLRQSLTHAD